MDKDISILDKLGVDVGFKVTHTKTITEEDLMLFARVTEDLHPVHVDEEYAKKTLFGGRIVHGILVVGLISAAVAKLPGTTILLSQSARFLEPVRIGDTITAVAEVTETRKDKGIVTLKDTCINQNGVVVVQGETILRFHDEPAQSPT